jgi:predicted phosphohydrolase
MNIYAISDLHLSFSSDKPMSVFGAGWENHFENIKKDWIAKVKEEDIVLIAGDISWAMKLSDAETDLKAIATLPGRKVLIRGNHDFWWSGIGKVRQSAPDNSFYFLNIDACKIDDFVFVGSRGWACPGSPDYSEQDKKLYLREAERFKLAFAEAEKLKKDGDKVIALIHYPPFTQKKEDTLFSQLFEEKKVDKVVFGHIHGNTFFPFKTEKNGVEYLLTSCDKTEFVLTKVY